MNDSNRNHLAPTSGTEHATLRRYCAISVLLFMSCGQSSPDDSQLSSAAESDATTLDETTDAADSGDSEGTASEPQAPMDEGKSEPADSASPNDTGSVEPKPPTSQSVPAAQNTAAPGTEAANTTSPNASTAPSAAPTADAGSANTTVPAAPIPDAGAESTAATDDEVAPAPTANDEPPSPPADLPLAPCSSQWAATADGSDFSINSETNQFDRHTLLMGTGDLIRRVHTYRTTGDADHQHYVEFQEEQLVALLNGETVTVATQTAVSNAETGHVHNIVVSPCPEFVTQYAQ